MRKFITLLFCLLCTITYSQDSKNRVRGKVQSESSKSILQNVHVLNLSKVFGTITDAEGIFEIDACNKGTFAVAKTIAESNACSIIGGGDSVKAINMAGYGDKVTFMSTGGGASLEFLEGKQLPGVTALDQV